MREIDDIIKILGVPPAVFKSHGPSPLAAVLKQLEASDQIRKAQWRQAILGAMPPMAVRANKLVYLFPNGVRAITPITVPVTITWEKP